MSTKEWIEKDFYSPASQGPPDEDIKKATAS